MVRRIYDKGRFWTGSVSEKNLFARYCDQHVCLSLCMYVLLFDQTVQTLLNLVVQINCRKYQCYYASLHNHAELHYITYLLVEAWLLRRTRTWTVCSSVSTFLLAACSVELAVDSSVMRSTASFSSTCVDLYAFSVASSCVLTSSSWLANSDARFSNTECSLRASWRTNQTGNSQQTVLARDVGLYISRLCYDVAAGLRQRDIGWPPGLPA